MAYVLNAIELAGRSAQAIAFDSNSIEIFMASFVTGGFTPSKEYYVPGTFKPCHTKPMLGSGGNVTIHGHGLAAYEIVDNNGDLTHCTSPISHT